MEIYNGLECGFSFYFYLPVVFLMFILRKKDSRMSSFNYLNIKYIFDLLVINI